MGGFDGKRFTTVLLRDAGWTVLRYWGNDIKRDVCGCAEEIIKAIDRKKSAFNESQFL